MAAVITDSNQGPEVEVYIDIIGMLGLNSNHDLYQKLQEAAVEIKVISKDYHPHQQLTIF